MIQPPRPPATLGSRLQLSPTPRRGRRPTRITRRPLHAQRQLLTGASWCRTPKTHPVPPASPGNEPVAALQRPMRSAAAPNQETWSNREKTGTKLERAPNPQYLCRSGEVPMSSTPRWRSRREPRRRNSNQALRSTPLSACHPANEVHATQRPSNVLQAAAHGKVRVSWERCWASCWGG